ncbi:MAG: cobalt ECF transporter T component CbiQ [Pseudomonadota bacterium]
MSELIPIQLPLWQMPLLVLFPLALPAVMIAGLRRMVNRRHIPEEERDWSVPPLTDGDGKSLLHRWDVRCKILTILVYSFIIASLRHLEPAAVAVAASLLVLMIARVPLAKVLLRLLALAGFLGMLLVVMPFTVAMHPGDTLLVFGGVDWLGLNLRGLTLAATIAAKAVAIALLMEPLLSTAPLPVTLHGLSRLGVPEMTAQMVLLSYRYLHVFRHEARRMSSGMKLRGFEKRTNLATLHALANFLGMLFVRSFERTERVFDAMRARGYQGQFPAPAELRMHFTDVLISIIWISAGIALIVYDRIILQV